ncbi:MAG: tRNA uridine-5-carboxymethylaminomethyl(34) synthesis GTPase MnmE [Treponema sp.]|jgi:tRNA modification GTPase|nr:tRNA uridine-5-carboxymethylaminomethyl(34) synthesis GTPase MnmE [Treponema sp.]
MSTPAYGDDAPIAAFATPLSESALALIRCSGKNAVELLAPFFSRPENLLNARGNTVVHGWIIKSGERIDEVLVSVFRAPRSFTGEESFDISCHGGISAARAVMRVLNTAGFRNALPGEFTFRAFMSGKLDLTRSESVMEIVSAKTDLSRRHAIQRLSGVLEQEIIAIKNLLVQALSQTEILLDYSEDEIGASNDEMTGAMPGKPQAAEALDRLKTLASSWRRERLYQEGALAVIAGRPNAGKSSLFNLLLKEERSIVTEAPGTTRDWIEAWISSDGIPIRLVDTAGLRDSNDPVEKIGVERSRELLHEADLILYVIDGETGITEDDRVFLEEYSQKSENRKMAVQVLALWNKADKVPLPQTIANTNNHGKCPTLIAVSAKTGLGITELTSVMSSLLGSTDTTETTAGIATIRQKNLIDTAIEAVESALELAANGEPLDLIAPQLRSAVNSLGEITGEVSTVDILEAMFSKFCVGK